MSPSSESSPETAERFSGELFAPPTVHQGRKDRVRWLIRLRWGAMLSASLGCVAGASGIVPGIAIRPMGAVVAFGLAYNFWLWQVHRRRRVDAAKREAPTRATGAHSPLAQALVDLLLLTLLLWAAGGVESPFRDYYVFHIALIAILGGPRWTLIAAGASLLGGIFLSLPLVVPALRLGTWNPVAPFDVVSEILAFAGTLCGTAYIVAHAARELRAREAALKTARDQAALEYQLLSNTLDELEAGLEVVNDAGEVLWRNKRAAELAPLQQRFDPRSAASEEGNCWSCPGNHGACEQDATGNCPIDRAKADGDLGRCRFAAQGPDGERVYEMMVFPIDESPDPRYMNLYVDRTRATLAERQLVLAERLASLGRVAQGVAHELNTPLATIRTLASDMRHAIAGMEGEAAEDLDESATLIRDETLRLGRITQALLAGGDLVRARIDGMVPLGSVVERARAIVFAGIREGVVFTVDPQLAQAEVSADMDRLVQVLVNLLQNAHDASRSAGGKRVHVGATIVGREVVLTVEDDGPGLDEAIEGRLFEPFATTKPPGEGTGLGLYTSYMLVQAMGGQLSLKNGDAGAIAELRLPAAGGPDVNATRLLGLIAEKKNASSSPEPS